MPFTIRCSKCLHADNVPSETVEWLCPICGTKMHVLYQINVVTTFNPPAILSDEQIASVTVSLRGYLKLITGVSVKGTRVKYGG